MTKNNKCVIQRTPTCSIGEQVKERRNALRLFDLLKKGSKWTTYRKWRLFSRPHFFREINNISWIIIGLSDITGYSPNITEPSESKITTLKKIEHWNLEFETKYRVVHIIIAPISDIPKNCRVYLSWGAFSAL